jgi:hypothetical protein
MQRLPLRNRDQCAEEVQAIYDAFLEKRGVVPNMIRTVAHSPGLVKGFAAFMGPLMGPGAVSQQLKELLALHVSLRNNCEFRGRSAHPAYAFAGARSSFFRIFPVAVLGKRLKPLPGAQRDVRIRITPPRRRC